MPEFLYYNQFFIPNANSLLLCEQRNVKLQYCNLFHFSNIIPPNVTANRAVRILNQIAIYRKSVYFLNRHSNKINQMKDKNRTPPSQRNMEILRLPKETYNENPKPPVNNVINKLKTFNLL